MTTTHGRCRDCGNDLIPLRLHSAAVPRFQLPYRHRLRHRQLAARPGDDICGTVTGGQIVRAVQAGRIRQIGGFLVIAFPAVAAAGLPVSAAASAVMDQCANCEW